MNSPDPQEKMNPTAERHRNWLIVLTAVGVFIPLLLAAMRLLGYI